MCCSLQTAHAAHPLVTDDTGIQGKGNHQIELNADRVRQNGALTSVGALTYTLGGTDHTDVFINAPATLTAPSGINDASLGVKWRFFATESTSTALKTELLLPTGSADKALGNGKPGLVLTLITSHTTGHWSVHGNASVTVNRYGLPSDRDSKRGNLWRVSVASVYSITPQWKIAADAGVSQDTERTENRIPGYVLGGAIYSPTQAVDIDAGIRFGVGCTACASQIKRQVGLGVTARF